MPAHANSGSFKKGHKLNRGEKHPRFLPIFTERIHKRGGKKRESHFRTVIKIGPGCKDWMLKSRFVVEQEIKRKLLPKEFVHHINGNTLDDRIENLSLLSINEHSQNHHAKVYTHKHTWELQTWSKKFSCCKKCGTNKKRHVGRGLCSTCWGRERFELLGYWP